MNLWILGIIALLNPGILILFYAADSSAQYPGDGKIYMPSIADGAIQVDGSLQECRELPHGYIDSFLDNIGSNSPGGRDRARFNLCHDNQALYFAIRVVDEHILPSPGKELYRGDCVQVFLDVRPLDAPEGIPRLGQRAYSVGSYQFTLSPPESAEDQLRWSHNPNGGPSSPLKNYLSTHINGKDAWSAGRINQGKEIEQETLIRG